MHLTLLWELSRSKYCCPVLTRDCFSFKTGLLLESVGVDYRVHQQKKSRSGSAPEMNPHRITKSVRGRSISPRPEPKNYNYSSLILVNFHLNNYFV